MSFQIPLLVLSAVEQELVPVKNCLSNLRTLSPGVWVGQFKSSDQSVDSHHRSLQNICLAFTQMGRESAKNKTEELLKKYSPKACLVIGYCGALSPKLKVGDGVISSEIILDDEIIENPNSLSNFIFDRASKGLLKTEGKFFHHGRTLTSSNVIESSSEKSELYKKWNTLSVDMELGEILKLCNMLQIPFLGLKFVVDTADQKLPAFNEEFLKSGKMDQVSYIKALNMHPELAQKLSENGKRAQQKMVAAVNPLLESLLKEMV